jgi:hypothetical protein
MVNVQSFDAKIYQHLIKWQKGMRLIQYCCMLVAGSDDTGGSRNPYFCDLKILSKPYKPLYHSNAKDMRILNVSGVVK